MNEETQETPIISDPLDLSAETIVPETGLSQNDSEQVEDKVLISSNDNADAVISKDELNKLYKRIQDKDDYIRQQQSNFDKLRNTQQQDPSLSPNIDNNVSSSKPEESSYDSYDEYIENLTDWKIDQKTNELSAKNHQKEQQDYIHQRTQQFENRAMKLRETVPDFDIIAKDPRVGGIYNSTPELAELIESSAQGPKIAYYLGKNIDVASKLAAKPLPEMALEIARLEFIASQKEKHKKTSAPTPIDTITGSTVTTGKDLNKVSSMDEFVQQRGGLYK
jgi:hypothetical protein